MSRPADDTGAASPVAREATPARAGLADDSLTGGNLPGARPPRTRGAALDAFLRWREASILVVAVLLAAGFELMNRDFLLSGASLENLSQFVAPTAIIAAGEIMLMIGGEIDLSAGMVFALAPFVLSYSHAAGLPLPLALALALLASAAIGLGNGAVTLLLGVPSFVTTLGSMFLLNGAALTWSRGTPATPPDAPAFAAAFGNWGYSEILWALAVTAGMHVLLRQTRGGCTPWPPAATRTARRRRASASPASRSATSC